MKLVATITVLMIVPAMAGAERVSVELRHYRVEDLELVAEWVRIGRETREAVARRMAEIDRAREEGRGTGACRPVRRGARSASASPGDGDARGAVARHEGTLADRPLTGRRERRLGAAIWGVAARRGAEAAVARRVPVDLW